MTGMTIAFLAGGKVHLQDDGEPARVVESEFAQSIQRRAQSMERKNAWKQDGRGAGFMGGGALLWGQEQNPLDNGMRITGLARGREPGTLLYSMTTSAVTGVFGYDSEKKQERRVYHGADRLVEGACASPEHEAIACSVRHKNGTSSIALMRADGSEIAVVTEGDTIDLSPRWIPSSPRDLVFQSAGFGRDANGNFAGIGPFGIQRLDVESGTLTSLVEDPERDFLDPKIDEDEALWVIARPYRGQAKPVSPFRVILDLLLAPFRLLFALIGFFNFFTVRYTGKPLVTSGDARSRAADTRRMMELGNIVNADRAARRGLEKEGDDREDEGTVPSSWKLLRIANGKEETIAKGVLSFDLMPNGRVVYTSGKQIFVRDKAGKATKVSDEKAVTVVVAIG